MNAIKNWTQTMEGSKLDKQVAGKIRDVYYLTSKILCEDTTERRQAALEAIERICKNVLTADSDYVFDIKADREICSACTSIPKKRSNKAIAHINPLAVLKLKQEREFIPRQYFCDKQRRDFIVDVVEALPFKKKICLLLHYYRELSWEEIVFATGMRKNTVKQQLKSAQMHIVYVLQKEFVDYNDLIRSYAFEPLRVPVLTQILHRDSSLMEEEPLRELAAHAEKLLQINDIPRLHPLE